MRIYGKTLPEIFRLLPWPYKIVVTMGTAFFIFAVPYSLSFFFTLGVYTQQPGPLSFPGLPNNYRGLMDPSIAVDENGTALMAHTVIQSVVVDGKPQYATNVVIERSKSPSCRSWTTTTNGSYLAQEDEAMFPDGKATLDKGVWTAETPSIVYDPDDPDKKWKLYVYEYYWNSKDDVARYYSFIGMKSAPTPEGPWTTKEWVLAADPPRRPPMPYAGLVKQAINPLHKDLADVWFYSRPSVIYHKGMLFMTLSAFLRGSSAPDFTVLLASTDHGKTWGYRGAPLSAADAEKAGKFSKYNGATLLLHGDQPYLAAVFGNADVNALGTFLIPFENPAGLIQAKVQRDQNGAPVIAKWIKRQSMEPSKTGGGHAAYAEKCDLGIVVSEFSDIRDSFQIFKTYKTPVSKD